MHKSYIKFGKASMESNLRYVTIFFWGGNNEQNSKFKCFFGFQNWMTSVEESERIFF